MTDDEVYEGLTLQRVRCLRMLADGRTAPEIARTLGVTVSGVRSHVANLKVLTGLQDVRALARWWRAGGRDSYLQYVAGSTSPGLPGARASAPPTRAARVSLRIAPKRA